MNITTENIDEWCFRYLEKDLDANECAFFERELETNAVLKKEFSIWKKTIVNTPALTKTDFNIANSLFRYKNQFMFVFAEFLLVSAFLSMLICFKPAENKVIEKHIVQPIKEQSSAGSASILTDRISVKKDSLKKFPTSIAAPIKESDSLYILPEKNKGQIISNETIQPIEPFSIPVTESKTIDADSSLTPKATKEKKKNKSSGYRNNGSRLIPINNDL